MPVYLVTGQDFSKNLVFKRVIYSKDKTDIIPKALHEENKERSFENRLLRSKLYYTVETLICFVPQLDDPRLVSESDHGNEVKVEKEQEKEPE